jgi:conjugal transfer ATP-binding protein TraC
MAGVIDKIIGDLFGGPLKRDKAIPRAAVPMLAHWLPYRSYDPAKGLYYNSASRGFIVEISPLVGADERTGEIISQFLSEGIPERSCLQIVQWMSPRVSELLGHWFLPRGRAGGIYRRMAQHRSEHLSAGVWDSLSADAPFQLRQHRVIISISIPEGTKISDEDLVTLRASMISMLKSIELSARMIGPVELLRLIDDMTSPTTANGEDPSDYNPFDPIADQAVRRDMELEVEPGRLIFRTERFRATGKQSGGTPEIGEIFPDRFDVRSYAVRGLPPRWAPWDTAKLIGDPFTDKLRMPCPVATVLAIEYPDEQAASARASFKFMRTTSLADSRSVRFLPQLKDQSREWEFVQDQLRQGQKLVRVFYGVTSFSPFGKGDAHERSLKAVYKACGWELQNERYLQIHGLLAALPMTMANGLARDFEAMKRLRTALTTTAANIAPLQGEYTGAAIPHLLLLGRRGQPFFWSPFENTAGNHNVAVFGKSGSGKSVTLQEIAAALVGAGARVIVIDDGRSFEHSCKLQHGDFVEFTMSSGFCLNPFSMIDTEQAAKDDDYRLDCIAMLKAIIGQMSRHMDRLSDTERGLIDSAVNAEWERAGSSGSIDGVIKTLEASGHEQGLALGIAMRPFARKGTYGRFFTGKASLHIHAALTVFELSDLAAREELRSVVLTAIMFLSSQAMRADRSSRKALLLDEAWQLLKGGSMADFVETYARTCRKYGASLITATQSLNDYYKSEGSIAALENSDWFIILQQKPETISDFKKLDRFDMNATTESLMRSLKRNGTEYSDVMIKGPATLVVGRLVLDPYSATVFSSSPTVFAAIEELVAQGHTMEAAIERVAYPNDPEKWTTSEEAGENGSFAPTGQRR